MCLVLKFLDSRCELLPMYSQFNKILPNPELYKPIILALKTTDGLWYKVMLI